MLLTTSALDELAVVTSTQPRLRAAQLATTLRLMGKFHYTRSRSVLIAELARASVAHRVQVDLAALCGSTAQVVEHCPDGPGTTGRYTVRVDENALAVVRQLGLIDRRGQPIRGLPPHVVGGTTAVIEAAWRGAFLASGTIFGLKRAALTVRCPTWESAMALSGAARRLAIVSKADDGMQVTIRGGDTITEFLYRLGATSIAHLYGQHLRDNGCDALADLSVNNFAIANERRNRNSAAISTARVGRALEILGESVPEHLAAFGRLRLNHPHVTLEELGRLATPPVSKDTASGRLRRLLIRADAQADVECIPDTKASAPL